MEEKQAEFQRGIHQWIIAAEDWDISTWRKNLKGAPLFLLESAKPISEKSEGERKRLVERATSLPADNVEDYVRYEIMADLSLLTNKALGKLVKALEINRAEGEPLAMGEVDWSIYGYDKQRA